MKERRAPVAEIFCSRQGEGLYAGQRQVFLRFAGCGLRCRYCDEPAALEGASGAAMTPAEAASSVAALARKGRAKDVSLTGGEPLLRAPFIARLAPLLKKAGLRLHLETNGAMPAALKKVAGLVDVVAMDIKLPSSTGERPLWGAHRRFLAAAPEKTFIKVVLTSRSTLKDFEKAVGIAAAAPAAPFFIQPATPRRGCRPPSEKFVREARRLAEARLKTVRVLPQQHPIWGIK